MEFVMTPFLESSMYTLFWLLVFLLVALIVDKITPWSLQKELIEDQNIALGIMFWCLFIAIAIIIASAIHWS